MSNVYNVYTIVSVFGARINYGSNCKIEEPPLVNE